MIPAPFRYAVPATLKEASQLLRKHEEKAKILAGGHSLIPLMKLRLAQPGWIIDLRRLNGLRKVTQGKGSLAIGALCTHRELEFSPLLRRMCPLLQKAASEIGDVQVRNRGTIGGSLAHGDPAADYPAAALVLEVELRAVSDGKSRTIPVSDFFLDMLTTDLRPGEILTRIRVPIIRNAGTAYLKLPQKASGFALVGAAALVKVREGRFRDVRLAFNGVASRPYRATAVEEALQGQRHSERNIAKACARAADGVELLGDIHASEEYRAHLATVYGRRAILAAVKDALK